MQIPAQETIIKILDDDGTFPNNAKLPLIIYKGAVEMEEGDATLVEKLFKDHRWGGSWRNGIFPYHHYHSTAHEVLGIYRGSAKVQLGGPHGIQTEVSAGDVIIIPAGVAHKNLEASLDFACVGAYPPGQSFDMNYGKAGERPEADQNIRRVAFPPTDPVYGDRGGLMKQWGLDR